MDCGAGNGGAGDVVAAPFVLKTYRMVSDPATDPVIAWGRENNSFVVADPFAFSQTLLAAHFKHNNFSSFVRQLNTYGFRKVDPDRWEFAHASFLRGQTHLLRRIVRRSCGGGGGGGGSKSKSKEGEGWEVDEELAVEVAKLRQEQRDMEEQVQGMWRRVHETERRPKQMMAFLLRVVGEPDLLRQLMSRGGEAGEKRVRLRLEGRGDGAVDPPMEVEEGFHSLALDCEGTVGDGEEEFVGVDDVDAFMSAVGYGGPGSMGPELKGVEMGAVGGGTYPYLYL